MSDKTKKQLEAELELIECLKQERELSDKLYAKIIVQSIVFTMVGFIALAFLGFLLVQIGWK